MINLFKWRQVHNYDGQSIFSGGEIVYELGNYLGGGASGSVYQAFESETNLGSEKSVAIKILNPLGFKNSIFGQMHQYTVIVKGKPFLPEQTQGKQPMTAENVWWLLHPTTKQIFAAFEDPHRMRLRELPLTRCVEIWGLNPLGIDGFSEAEVEKVNMSAKTVIVGEKEFKVPLVSQKYLKFLKSRQQVCREMSNMVQIGEHPNIIALKEVLELIQDTKTTLFLVLELINGGELFDRIKSGHQKNPEDFARKYFRQLLSGIDFCHKKGIVHRDLKPENLLLSDTTDTAILKIADFGLSAVIFATEAAGNQLNSSNPSSTPQQQLQQSLLPPMTSAACTPVVVSAAGDLSSGICSQSLPQGIHPLTPKSIRNPSSIQQLASSLPATSCINSPAEGNANHGFITPARLATPCEVSNVPVRRLRSVVGSPHYIAPEVANDDPAGYDGRKVDMWSAGIIFYSMFTTSLPFGSDLHNCVRYKRFREWLQRDYAIAMKEGKEFQIPIWFWPTHISPLASDLLIKLLQTDPTQRITAAEALRHPWCRVGLSTPDDNLQPGSSCPTPILQNALHDNMHLELGETGVPLSTAMSVIANEHDEQMHDPDSGVPSKPTAAPAGLTHKMLSQDPNGTNFTTTGNNNNITNSINKNERTPTAPVSRQLFSEAIGTAPNGPGTSLPVTSLLSASLANVQTNPGAYATQSAANPTIYDNSHSSAGPKLRHLQQPSVQVNHVTGTTNQPEQQQQKPSQQQQTSQSSGWQYDREAILQQQRQKEAEVLALYQLQHQQQLVQQQANAQRLQQPPQSPYVHYQQENGQIAISPHVPFQSSPLLFVQQHQHQHQQHSEQANFFLARPAPSGSLAQYSVSSSFGSSPLAGSPPFLYPSQAQLVMNRSEHGSTMEIAAPVASMMVDDGSLQSSGGFVENQQSSLPQRHGHISKMMTMEVDATYESTTSSKYPPRPPQYKSDALGDGSGPAILSPAGMSHVSVTSPANSVMAGQYLQSKEASLLLR